MATRRNLKPTNTSKTMKTKITCIALALAGIVAAAGQDQKPEGQRRGPGGPADSNADPGAGTRSRA